jgi:hypothetical protein
MTYTTGVFQKKSNCINKTYENAALKVSLSLESMTAADAQKTL